MITLLLAVSIGCLFTTLIYILIVAIIIALIVWAIGYLSGLNNEGNAFRLFE